MAGQGFVRVGVRVRPPFEDEIEDEAWVPAVRVVAQGSTAVVRLEGAGERAREFGFDYGFPPESSQVEVFERMAAPVIDEVLERSTNGTILAYGQTGTGKTYTLGLLERLGAGGKDAGIVPRALARVFDASRGARVTMSFLQIYRETIHDLLAPQPSKRATAERARRDAFGPSTAPRRAESLAIRENPVSGFYVEGLREYVVRDLGEAEALVNFGLENRALAPTLMNATSSRSHTVLAVNVARRSGEPSEGSEEDDDDEEAARSKLMFVDLAGSERVRRTASRGARLAEARAINASLAALGNVIAALADDAKHVPFRDSKLTRLLQDSLTGLAGTALVATLGPAKRSAAETLSTLTFASRCAQVRLAPPPRPTRSAGVDHAAECARMRRRLASLEADFADREAKQKAEFEAIIANIQNKSPRRGGPQSHHPPEKSAPDGDLARRASLAAAYAEALLDAACAGADFSKAVAAATEARALADDDRQTLSRDAAVAAVERLITLVAHVLPLKLRQTLDDRDAHQRRLVHDVESWSLVLEHLVATNAKLKAQLRHAAKLHPDARVRPLAWRDDQTVPSDGRGGVDLAAALAAATDSAWTVDARRRPSPSLDTIKNSPNFSQLDVADSVAAPPFDSPPPQRRADRRRLRIDDDSVPPPPSTSSSPQYSQLDAIDQLSSDYYVVADGLDDDDDDDDDNDDSRFLSTTTTTTTRLARHANARPKLRQTRRPYPPA
ncbi:hypothetical protein CTAYLR_000205 [Chrysophaeum taylorii]|uniref:Kinesin-like protein n=1 Tax=Chrysophaeum taylorii TaxID=2483200 RepID=A0AAD7UGA6_9STRA|nr:hypothetical protein CTAYLR_000205 [Chrysophaeum taylorii]